MRKILLIVFMFSFITKTSANSTKLAYDFNFNVDHGKKITEKEK